MQAYLEQKAFISLAGLETENHLWSKQMRSQGLSGSARDFWQLWAQYQDYFYNRCLRWMSGNPIDAEDALSQAMLKAWNEWPKYARKITNPKAWLSRITHNLCIDDIHRKRQRERMENIEDIQCVAHAGVTCNLESAESEIFRHELRAYLNHRIESLPPRLRDPFILHYCQEKSLRDIPPNTAVGQQFDGIPLTNSFSFASNYKVEPGKNVQLAATFFIIGRRKIGLGGINQDGNNPAKEVWSKTNDSNDKAVNNPPLEGRASIQQKDGSIVWYYELK